MPSAETMPRSGRGPAARRAGAGPVRSRVPIPVPNQELMRVTISVSQPYTNRVATLQRVSGTWSAPAWRPRRGPDRGSGGGAAADRPAGPPAAGVQPSGTRRAGRALAALRRGRGGRAWAAVQRHGRPAERIGPHAQADRDRLREFVADVSHELRTPIAALRTFTAAARRSGRRGAAPEFLDRSTEQINRLEWMSTNLLDLSRIDAGIFPLDMRWGDLRDPVRAVVEAHSEQAEDAASRWSARCRPARSCSASTASGSSAPQQPGRQRAQVHQARRRDRGRAGRDARRRSPGGARLRSGHPEAELLVFDRFFRGTNVAMLARRSGLGLAIARSIVEMHGGRIEAASAVGQGSVFTVDLPRSGGSDCSGRFMKLHVRTPLRATVRVTMVTFRPRSQEEAKHHDRREPPLRERASRPSRSRCDGSDRHRRRPHPRPAFHRSQPRRASRLVHAPAGRRRAGSA